MYRFLLTLLLMVGMTPATDAQQRQDMNKTQSANKIAVVYFSATGTTARVAERLARITGGELYAIVPAQPYTSADLDWNDKRSRSSAEMNDPESRPSLGGIRADISSCDIVFIGYPIWWNLAPRIINTFIEHHDLSGKTVVPFATSGSSSIAGSVAALKASYPALNWKEGRRLNGADEKDIRSWIEKTGVATNR